MLASNVILIGLEMTSGCLPILGLSNLYFCFTSLLGDFWEKEIEDGGNKS